MDQKTRRDLVEFMKAEKTMWGEGEQQKAAYAEIDAVIAEVHMGGLRKITEYLQQTLKECPAEIPRKANETDLEIATRRQNNAIRIRVNELLLLIKREQN